MSVCRPCPNPTTALYWQKKTWQQRGPGEFLGTRQSGYASGLRMASITDVKLIEKARGEAQKLFERDPYLEPTRSMPCWQKPLKDSGARAKGMSVNKK